MSGSSEEIGPGSVLSLQVEKLVAGGSGLARHEGLVVLVAGTLPGEQVEAEITERKRDFARARPLRWDLAAATRRRPPCAHAQDCGGCSFQHAAAEAQARLKSAIVVDCLERAEVALPGEPRVHSSPETGWRVRAVVHARRRRGEVRLGFFEAGTHEVVDLRECSQLAPGLAALVPELRERLGSWLGGGAIREVVIACDGADQRRAIEIRAGAGVLGRLGRTLLSATLPSVDSVGLSEARPGARYRPVVGEPMLEHVVGGVSYRAHVRSFFQANRFLVEPLVAEVLAAVPSDGRVVDLYSGVGLFSLAAAQRGQDVVGVESDGLAVAAARESTRRAGLEACRFVRGEVAAVLGRLERRGPETVILDPPRSGAAAELSALLRDREPERIVYVSCDPATLGRDLRRLTQAGYALRDVCVLDMFPTTSHVETVAVLEK